MKVQVYAFGIELLVKLQAALLPPVINRLPAAMLTFVVLVTEPLIVILPLPLLDVEPLLEEEEVEPLLDVEPLLELDDEEETVTAIESDVLFESSGSTSLLPAVSPELLFPIVEVTFRVPAPIAVTKPRP